MTHAPSVAETVVNAFAAGATHLHVRNLPFAEMEPEERDRYIRDIARELGPCSLTTADPRSDLWQLDRRTSPSRDRIPFHTDNPFLARPERVVSFWNVRGSEVGGENVLLPIRSLIDACAADASAGLLRELASTSVTFSQGTNETAAPMLDTERLVVRFDARYVSPDAQPLASRFAALAETIARRERVVVKLAPGDALFFDNHRVLHAREPYEDESRMSVRVRINPFFAESSPTGPNMSGPRAE